MKIKDLIIKVVKVFCEAGLAAVLAMLGINVTAGCVNPNFAKEIHEYCK